NKNTNLDIDKCNDNTKLQPARLSNVSTSVNTNHSVGNQDVTMYTSSSGNWSQAHALTSESEPTTPSKPTPSTELIEQIGIDNFSCKPSTNCLKIMTTNSSAYRTQIHFIKE
ncbi:Reverse transcriptase domain-containing protein, partial [Aphis craccivora]